MKSVIFHKLQIISVISADFQTSSYTSMHNADFVIRHVPDFCT